MNQSYFEDLLNKYVTGNLTVEENSRLSEMIADPAYAEVLDQYVREILLSDEFAGIDSPAVKAGIFTRLDAFMQAPANSRASSASGMEATANDRKTAVPVPPRIGRRRVLWYAAAAVLVLLFWGGGYALWIHRKLNNSPSIPPALAKDIQPGHSGAILTLEGGRQVVLDSTADGDLSRQGNTEVIKTNGQIAYRPEGTETESVYNTMSTPRGRQYELVLSDGTHVWLNAASSITYPTAFTGKDRRVTITGEAYLEVAPDPRRPFSVGTGGTTIDVLGTHFNVNNYPDESRIKTTLLEGKVRVSDQGNALLLEPGQQAQTGGPKKPERVQQAAIGEVMAWKNGYFQFNGASIQEILRPFSRWYDIEIVYEGALPDRRFIGKVGRDYTLSEALAVLGASDIHFRIDGRRMIVTP